MSQRKRDAMDTFWYWVRERYLIWLRRDRGDPPPWTEDPILATQHFTNVYRERDPGTQYIVEAVRPACRAGRQLDALLNVLVYRLALHEDSHSFMGWLCVDGNVQERVQASLETYPGSPWTPAYMVSNHGRAVPKAIVVAETAQRIARALPGVYQAASTAPDRQAAHKALQGLYGVGRFLAFQVLVDCCYPRVGLLPFSNDGWATCGPGAWRGLQRLCPGITRAEEQPTLVGLGNMQRQRLPSGQPHITRANLQNCLCEFDKYSRAQQGRRGRQRTFDAEAAHSNDGSQP